MGLYHPLGTPMHILQSSPFKIYQDTRVLYPFLLKEGSSEEPLHE